MTNLVRAPVPVERGASWLILLVVGAIVVIVAVGAAAILFRPSRALSGYTIDVAADVRPQMIPTSVVAVAVAYLDEQTPALAAPDLHVEPSIIRVVAAQAADVRTVEPAISDGSAMAQPERIVWVVFAVGDFLNLHDLPWSSASRPDPKGTVVIDDASGTILGVFPAAEP